MKTKLESETPVASHGLFCVGLPDSQGGMCWLAGYKSDPTRYYSPELALKFKSRLAAERAIKRAEKTHPWKPRTYIIIPVEEMDAENVRPLATPPLTPQDDAQR